jgi:hypothetical protein
MNKSGQPLEMYKEVERLRTENIRLKGQLEIERGLTEKQFRAMTEEQQVFLNILCANEALAAENKVLKGRLEIGEE